MTGSRLTANICGVMSIEAIVLGRAQDGGLPQASCDCPHCAAARAGLIPREFAASLAIVDQAVGEAWLIDAGPDFREQLALFDELRPGIPLAGIIITHAHIGHYTGLMYLGREAMCTYGLSVYGTPRLCDFLARNAPWSQLVDIDNIALQEQQPGSTFALTDDLSIEFVPVPHRAEFTDTMAVVVRGPTRSLFYCPDIDSWDKWDRDVRDLPDIYDVSMIDGTFFEDDDLPGLAISTVPHPPVQQSMRLIGPGRNRVFFTHLNHSNPLFSVSETREELKSQGYDVVEQGQVFEL
jgi:pyrroloquinoline quinone biosynthesis protein B